MILIDEQAEIRLDKALANLSIGTPGNRCLHINYANQPEKKQAARAARDYIINLIRQHIALPNQQVFLCDDGDIFILAPAISNKATRQLVVDIAAYLKITFSDDIANLYDLSVHGNKLRAILEERFEQKQKIEQEKQKIRELETLKRRRAGILNQATKNNSDEIIRKRTNRDTPELMIIEDDAFSRRLVENVLQKEYHLTSHGTADIALSTYANLAPDILFLDINLPDVSGHELLEKIIAIDPLAYVIMLSGNSDKENVTQAMRNGAKGFIAKPFTKEKITQYISRCPTIKS